MSFLDPVCLQAIAYSVSLEEYMYRKIEETPIRLSLSVVSNASLSFGSILKKTELENKDQTSTLSYKLTSRE
jgi:hypothetical protein